MPERIKLLIAEDDNLLRRTLVELFQLDPSFDIVAHVSNGQSALEQAGVTQPDVMLTDIDMPVMDGIEATKHFRSMFPDASVVVLTKFDNEENLFDAIRAGASGYVLKDASVDEIKQSIREAREGQGHLNPVLVARVLAEFNRISQANKLRKESLKELTPREFEVLELLGQGMKNRAIADKLFLSEKTVKSHVGAVLRKLHVNDRTEAALLAHKHGLN